MAQRITGGAKQYCCRRAAATPEQKQDAAKRAEDHRGRDFPEDTDEKGIVKLSSATDSDSEALAATPKAVKPLWVRYRPKRRWTPGISLERRPHRRRQRRCQRFRQQTRSLSAKLIAALVGSGYRSHSTLLLQELAADALGNEIRTLPPQY